MSINKFGKGVAAITGAFGTGAAGGAALAMKENQLEEAHNNSTRQLAGGFI